MTFGKDTGQPGGGSCDEKLTKESTEKNFDASNVEHTAESKGPPAFNNIYNERNPADVLRENEFPVTYILMERNSFSPSSLTMISVFSFFLRL